MERYELHIHFSVNITAGDIIGSGLVIGSPDSRATVTNAQLPPELAEAVGRAIARFFGGESE